MLSRIVKGTFLSLLLGSAVTACTDDNEALNVQNTKSLQIEVGVNQPESRALVTGKNLPDGASIGVTVVDNSGTAYQQQNYNNVAYTAATDGEGKQQWTPDRDITLSGEKATLYAYYPFTNVATDFVTDKAGDIHHILVNMDEEDQRDWMFATPVLDRNDADNVAQVVLNHALSDVRLTVYKENYSGEGKLSSYTLQSDAFAVSATLDAATGTFTDHAPTQDAQLTRNTDLTLTDKNNAEPMDVMVVPNGNTDAISISMTVDGHTYQTITAQIAMEQGKAYNVVLKLTSTGLNVMAVTLTNWQNIPLPDAEFKPNKPQQTEENYFIATFQVPESQVDKEFYLFYDYDAMASEEEKKMLFKTAFIKDIQINSLSIDKNSYEKISFSEAGAYQIKVILNDAFNGMYGMFGFIGINSLMIDNQNEFFKLSSEERDLLVDLDLSHLNTSEVQYMMGAFAQPERPFRFNSLDLSYLKTDKAVNMAAMFAAVTLESLDISGFNTENVEEMSAMFQFCAIKNMDMSGLDLSNVKSMGNMFYYCSNLTKVTMTGALHPEVVTTNMFGGITTNGTFYYDNRYDYSKIIDVLPDTWTAVPLNL